MSKTTATFPGVQRVNSWRLVINIPLSSSMRSKLPAICLSGQYLNLKCVTWAFYQIRKIAGDAVNVFPATTGLAMSTCITAHA